MPPPVAALIFIGFVFWLFRRDTKLFGSMSPSLWVPFIWICIITSRPVGYWLSSGTIAANADVSSGSFIDRNAYLLLMVMGAVVLMKRQVDWQPILTNCRWLIVLYAYYLISVTWSDYSYVSLKRWVKDIGDIMMVLIILTEKKPVEAIRRCLLRCIYVLAPVSVLFVKYYPELGRYTHRWTYETMYSGVTTNKNSLGLLAMLGGLTLLWNIVDMSRREGEGIWIKKKWPDMLMLAICIWLLNIAGSSSSLFGFIIGAAIFFGSRLNWVKRNFRYMSFCLFGLALVMVCFTASTGFRSVIAGLLDRDVTLTDRTLIWEASLEIGTNPLIGSGFSSVWLTPEAIPLLDVYNVPHSHNGYLENYLDGGIIGILLLLVVLISGGKNVSSQLLGRSLIGNYMITLFLVILLYNYTEVTYHRQNTLGLILWLIAAYGPVVRDIDSTQMGRSVIETA